MKKVCVVGGSGYVGSYLAHNFSANYEVTVFSRRPLDEAHITKNEPVITMYGDVKNDVDLLKIAEKSFDVIIYCVSLNHIASEKSLTDSIDINFIPLKNLVENLALKGFGGKFIYLSTMQVCGAIEPGSIITEDFPAAPTNNYGLTHLLCENTLSLYSKSNRLDACSIRLSNSYGLPIFNDADCWWLVVNDLCKAAVLDKKITLKSDGTPQRDFISLQDVSRAIEILAASKKKMPPLLNLASGDTRTIYGLAKIVSELAGQFGMTVPIEFSNKNHYYSEGFFEKKRRFKIQTSNFESIGFRPIVDIRSGISQMLEKLTQKFNLH